jgi:hypothetical protein
MSLYQVVSGIELHGLPVDANTHRLPAILRWDRVERVRHLHVVVGVDLGFRPARHIERRRRRRGEERSLFGVEDIQGDTASSAVDACARDLDAPALGRRTKHG